MKILLTLTAAALTTAALSLPASAGTIGCKSDQPDASVHASDCRTWHQTSRSMGVPSSRSLGITHEQRASGSLAYAPRSRSKVVRQQRFIGPSDNEGVKGGSAN